MSSLQITGLVFLGILVGVIGTLIGAGGGFVLVPILALVDPREPAGVLTAISLTVVFANALSGSIAYARMRRIDYRSGIAFALAGVPGALLGAWLSRFLDRRIFDPLLGATLIGAGLIVFWRPAPRRGAIPTSATRRLTESDGTAHAYSPRVGLGAALSMIVGFLSSLLGIGGGIFHVPAMALLFGFPTHVATATSHFVLAQLAVVGVLVHLADGTVRSGVDQIVPLAIGVILGAPAGAWLSRRARGPWILRGLAVALASVGLKLLLAAHPSHAAVATPPSEAAAFDHSAFDSLLRENVRDGLVDYHHIRSARLGDLDHYLDRLATFDLNALPRDERLAFLIDLYNASMIRAAVARLSSSWSPADSGFAVFHEPLVRIGGAAISLDSLERGLILPRFHEPRVHLALVCAARSCPPILPRAYRGADLDRTLERNLKTFASDPRRNRVDESSRTLRLSPIFKWYARDFAPLGGPIAILARARGREFRGWKLAWLDYDWSLNALP